MPDESTEMIEQQMQETRDSLTQKVSALESQVVGTLQNATATVSSMVDQVKTAVPETLAGMKDTISEVKESVAKQLRETLDVSRHTREKPWAMLGGAMAAGFITGMVLFRRTYAAPTATQSLAATSAPSSFASAPARSPIKLPGWLDQIVDKLGDRVSQEVRKLGEVAVATASTSLQSTVEKMVPQFLGGAGQPPDPEAGRNGFHATASSRI